LSDFKEQAEALRVGLLAGYVLPDEIVSWADGLIAAGDVPEPELIEVSLSGRKSVDELARALKAIKGDVYRPRLARVILGQMAAAVRRDAATGRAVARQLEQMYFEDLVPSPEARDQMGRLDDAFALAESGSWGTLAEVQTELVEFLSEWTKGSAEPGRAADWPRE
jgi:hypothetical protein